MNEEFLHYIWQHKLYYPDKLITEDGQLLEIINPGLKNTNAGPDFFNAKIKLNNTLWAGNVEIHLNEQEWNLHGHNNDKSYDNVILHVVNTTKGHTCTSSGRQVTVWKMKYGDTLIARYQSLFLNALWIPCEKHIQKVEAFVIDQWLQRILIEKMESKSDRIKHLLSKTKNDWDQVFFILLSRSFGFGVNGQAFEQMSSQTPLKILLKHSENLFQLEALLFGQSGLLNDLKTTDEYTNELKKEYQFLARKYQLKGINKHLWKFLRLRPSNFPTVRIAQLAALIHSSKGLFHTLQNKTIINDLTPYLSVNASSYWDNHYTLGKQSSKVYKKQIGLKSKLVLIFNTIYPYLFVFHEQHNNDKCKENILEQLFNHPPEQNQILNTWESIGIPVLNEARAQSLIFLKNHYCNHKKCLNCHIGHKVLSTE